MIALCLAAAAALSGDGIAMSGQAMKVLVFERAGGWIWRARTDGRIRSD
jgi:hypothetical protein